jgi:hypothetical protein
MPRKPLTIGEWCAPSPGAKGNGSCPPASPATTLPEPKDPTHKVLSVRDGCCAFARSGLQTKQTEQAIGLCSINRFGRLDAGRLAWAYLSYDAPPGGGVAALGWDSGQGDSLGAMISGWIGGWGGVVVSGQEAGQLFGRRRRANAAAGQKRTKRYPVTVTEVEAAELEAKAAAAGMTVPRLLHESAKSAHVETSTERKAAIAELFSVRREVAGIATNLNQLARYANTEGTFPGDAVEIAAEFRRLFPRVTAAVARLAES